MDSRADDARIATRRRRARLAIAGLTVAAALVGSWVAGRQRPDSGGESSGAPSSEAADAGPGGLLAHAGRAKRAASAETAADDDARGGLGSATGPASRPRMASPGPTWIVGEVVDEAGTPMPWARVGMYMVMRWQTRGRERTVLLGQGLLKADAEGRFWRNLFLAGYESWLVVEDDRSFTSEPVLATSGGDPVRLVATRRRTTRVRVEDAKGHPLVGASVTVRPIRPTRVDEWTLAGLHAGDWPTAVKTADRTELRAVTDADGLASCSLPDARVRVALDVEPPIDRDDLLRVHLAPWTPADEVTVRLPVGLPVSGRVVDAKGRPWTAGVVRWTPTGGEPADAKIAYDGTFEVPPQPPGPIRLALVAPNLLQPRESRPTVVAAGATDVVLVLDTANELDLRVANRPKGAGGKAYLSVDGTEAGSRGVTVVDLENDGTAVLRGLLDDETYVLWVPAVLLDTTAVSEGLEGENPNTAMTGLVYRRGVTVRDSPLVVEEVAGEGVELEIDGDGRWYPESASIADRGVRGESPCVFLYSPGSKDDGSFVLRHRTWFPSLPPGDWVVRVLGSDMREDDAKPVSVEVTVKPGAKIHVDFAPPDERRR